MKSRSKSTVDAGVQLVGALPWQDRRLPVKLTEGSRSVEDCCIGVTYIGGKID